MDFRYNFYIPPETEEGLDVVKELDKYRPPRHGGMASRCLMPGYAKTSSQDKPFLVPNEYICNRLALVLGLPVALGLLARFERTSYFASHEVFEHELPINPPPLYRSAVPRCIEDHPRDTVGIVVFDAWIVNQDRHAGNLLYDQVGSKVLSMLDHGEALLVGPQVEDALARLQSFENRAGVEEHILSPALQNTEAVESWIAQIKAMGEHLIHRVCAEGAESGYKGSFTSTDATNLADYLLDRRERLAELLGQHTDQPTQGTS